MKIIRGVTNNEDVRSEGEFRRDQDNELPMSQGKNQEGASAGGDLERLGSAASKPLETDPGIGQIHPFNRRGTGAETEPDCIARDMKSEAGVNEELASQGVEPPVAPIDEIIPEETIVKSSKEPSLRPLHIKESEAEHFLTTYFEKLPRNVRDSYPNPQDTVKRAQNSLESYWLELPELSALCVFCVEAAYDRLRAVILHASTTVPDQLDPFIGIIKDYIWKNVNTNEIKVELKYIQEQNSFAPCESLKAAYSQKNGFKWKTLLNDSTKGYENRTLVLGVSRPADAVFENPRKLDTAATSITLKHCSIIDFTSKPPQSPTGKGMKSGYGCLLYSPCSLIEALLRASQDEDIIIDTEGTKEYFTEVIKMSKTVKEKGKIDLCATRGVFSEGDIEPINSLLESQKMSISGGIVPRGEAV